MPDPDPERWQEQLKETMRDARRVLLRHRSDRFELGLDIPVAGLAAHCR